MVVLAAGLTLASVTATGAGFATQLSLRTSGTPAVLYVSNKTLKLGSRRIPSPGGWSAGWQRAQPCGARGPSAPELLVGCGSRGNALGKLGVSWEWRAFDATEWHFLFLVLFNRLIKFSRGSSDCTGKNPSVLPLTPGAAGQTNWEGSQKSVVLDVAVLGLPALGKGRVQHRW